MTETPNLKLKKSEVTEYYDVKVQNENMDKIDTAIGNLVSTEIPLKLSPSSWVGATAPFTQKLTVTGVTPTSSGVIGMANNLSAAQRESSRKAILSCGLVEVDAITIICDGEVPTIELPISLQLIK